MFNMETKICNDCGETKIIDLYNKSKSGRCGVNNTCKLCRSNKRKNLNYKRTTLETVMCTSCDLNLPSENFHSDKTSKNGLQTYCKVCQTNKTYLHLSKFKPYINNLFKNLITNAKKRNIRVEITVNDIFNIYEKQNGKCIYSGISMTHNKMPSEIVEDMRTLTTNPYNISIDRIDSTRDYNLHNIQLVTVSINHMKWNLSEQVFIEMCNLVSINNNKNKIPLDV